jgi:hypothetical protein
MAVVDELEVIEIQRDQREWISVAFGSCDGLSELILERALIRQIRQAVSRRALQRAAVTAKKCSTAEQVEHCTAAEKR